MKKNNVRRNFSDSDDDRGIGKKGTASKDKASKKRLSIYDDYEEDDDIYPLQEKFRGRRK